MKKFLAALVACVALGAVGCETATATATTEQAPANRTWWRYYSGGLSDSVVSEPQYLRHDATGLCFAIVWGGGFNGGPAMAHVPCEAIPAELLRTE